MDSKTTMAVSLARQAAQQIAARAGEADKKAALPPEDVALLRDSGYLALSVPEEYDGYGLSLADCVRAQIELAQGSAATALVAGMQLHLFGHQREARSWRGEAYERLCHEAAQGALFNSAASEPKLGSPSRGGLPATTAVPNADDTAWIVNGRKTWTTGGRHLTHLLVRVTVAGSAAEDAPREAGVVLVEGNRPGITWQETWRGALSLRASDSHDVIFEDVTVPRHNLIERGDRPQPPNVWFPMIMSAVYLGSAIAARNALIQFALERTPTSLGEPIATLPAIQRQIGEIDVALQATQAFFLQVAEAWTGEDADRRPFLARVAAAKMSVAQTAAAVTEKALQVAGGSSITGALSLERHFRDVRAIFMQPPSGDTAYEMVGRAALGL